LCVAQLVVTRLAAARAQCLACQQASGEAGQSEREREPQACSLSPHRRVVRATQKQQRNDDNTHTHTHTQTRHTYFWLWQGM
jgi:hypothetical protein